MSDQNLVSLVGATYTTFAGAAGGCLSGHMTLVNWLVVAAIFPAAFAILRVVQALIDRWIR